MAAVYKENKRFAWQGRTWEYSQKIGLYPQTRFVFLRLISAQCAQNGKNGNKVITNVLLMLKAFLRACWKRFLTGNLINKFFLQNLAKL